MIDGEQQNGGVVVIRAEEQKGVCCIHLNSLSRLSPSKSPCTVYVAQFVPPVVILSAIYQVTNHQPPVLSGHYKGATKEEACLKERPKRRWKEAAPCLWTVQHNPPKTGKLGISLPLWPIHTYPGKKKADNQIVGSRFLATGFFIWDRINQISQVCPHVHHPFVPAA